MNTKNCLTAAAVALVLVAGVTANMFLPPSNIDAVLKMSWSENTGWMNWRDADAANEGILVGDDFLTGYIWAENIGWINAGDGNGPYANATGQDFGVNILPNGDLAGMGWAENVGWLNFGWAASTINTDRARFDSGANRFRGFAWAENIGWVNLDDDTHFVTVVPMGVLDPVEPDTSPDKVRFISFEVPSTSAGTNTALRVRLTSLHHPTNPPPGTPDFASFEGQYRYVNTFNGTFTCPDSANQATSYACAQLGCQPEYRDWGAEVGGQVLHVTGNAVVSSSLYDISHIAGTCGAAPAADTCADASPELAVATARWGDVVGPGNGPPDNINNVLDISATVDKVKDLPQAFAESRIWHKQRNPNPLGEAVNVIDIASVVDAVKNFPYPPSFTIDMCP